MERFAKLRGFVQSDSSPVHPAESPSQKKISREGAEKGGKN